MDYIEVMFVSSAIQGDLRYYWSDFDNDFIFRSIFSVSL